MYLRTPPIVVVLIAFGCLASLGLGCASPSKSAGPAWIADCHVFGDAGAPQSLCGVGAAGYSRDVRLLDRSARERAVEPIEATLRTAMYDTFQAAGGSTERHATRLVEELVEESLESAAIVATWAPSDGSRAYALASLEVEAVRTVLSKENDLPDNVQADVLKAVSSTFPARK